MPLSYNNPKMHNFQTGPSFQTGANPPYGTYAPFNPMHQQQQQTQKQAQQQSFFSPSQQQPLQQQPQPPPQQQSQPVKPILPPGKNDLEILQNLKKIIKDGQHPFFRAVPKPAALASINIGTSKSDLQHSRDAPAVDDKKSGSLDIPKGSIYDAKDDLSRPGKGLSDDASGMHVDDRRLSAVTIDDRCGRPLHASDYTPPNQVPSDSRPQPDSRPQTDSHSQPNSRPQPDSRGVPGSSRGESVDSEHPSHYPGLQLRGPKDTGGGGGGGGSSFNGPPRLGNRGPSASDTPPSNGAPMPGSGSQAPSRSFHAHSPLPDSRGAKPMSSLPGVTRRHPLRGPPLERPTGREDRSNYRAEYDPRRPDVLDGTTIRYGDGSYRGSSPPPWDIPRGGGRPSFPPSSARAPPDGDVSSRRGEWLYHRYSASSGALQSWDIEDGWDRSGDRERFEKDVPPRSEDWEYRGERDFITRDGYSSGSFHDDRGYASGPPSRDTDRGRPGPYAAPPYGRVRPRSSSPMRRTGSSSVDDSRPALKRPREEFLHSGYYSPRVPPPPAGNRRPPGEYPPPPPRSGSSGPPPSSASSWPPPLPPTSGGSGAGGPPSDRDRNYRTGRDGMDFRPPSAGYDRPRSPGPLGRHSYDRGSGSGGYGRVDPRDRGGYGISPRP